MGTTTKAHGQVRRGELTDRQRLIWQYMLTRQRDHGRPPTVREIGDQFGIASPNGVTVNLKAIVRKGYAVNAERTHRGHLAVVPGGKEPLTATGEAGVVRLVWGGVVILVPAGDVAGLVSELVAAEAEALES